MSWIISPYRGAIRAALSTIVLAGVGLLAGAAQAAPATPYGLTFDPSQAVLVSTSGNDSTGQGTTANPYRTIGKGVQVAAALRENVYVAGGTYDESVLAVSTVGIYGGFDPSSWQQSSTQTTIQPPAGSEQAVLADGATNVVLEALTLRGPNGTQASRGATNSYGLREINGASVALLGVTASGGHAADGVSGSTPNGGVWPGGKGTDGSDPTRRDCLPAPAGGAGDPGRFGNGGGSGGAGGGFSGSTALSGGAGGDGFPQGAKLGGAGGAAQQDGPPQDVDNGKDGGAGAQGLNGAAASSGADQGDHGGSADWTGADGGTGTQGAAGHGGGGGGGGGARSRQCLCTLATAGGSGGGGGSGGEGGLGGIGGQAGGASFAVFLQNSTLVAPDSSLAGDAAGAGGNGASGQSGAGGGDGGTGSSGAACGGLSVTSGGNGGNGGAGGQGGTGGGGAGGPSAAIYDVSSSFALRDTSTVAGQPGGPGSGGSNPAVPGQSSETIPAGTTSDTTLDFDHDGVADVNDLCPTVPGGPTDLSGNGCPGSPSPLPQNTSVPTIVGQAVQGQVLTEVHGAWTNGAFAFQYQWSRCDASGNGCVSVGTPDAAYTLGAADVGSTIRVSEIASNGVGSSDPALSKPTSAVRSGIPANAAAPSIVGSAAQGQTLSAQHGDWSNGPTGFQDQWQRCDASGNNCVSVGNPNAEYELGAADVGSTIRVSEVASNGVGASDPAVSKPTVVVRGALPAYVAAPSIAGGAVEGQTLSAQRGVWSNGPTGFQDQWFRCDASGSNCQQIPGAQGLSYALSVSDVGATIRVREVAGNSFGSGAPATSAATAPVADAPISVQAFALVGTVRSIVPGPIASFSDPADRGAPAGSYSATIAWGDQQTSQGTAVPGRGGGYFVTGSHAYARPGNYTLTVRVHAAAGAVAVSSNRVSVFTAKTCTKGAHKKGRNCLGDIALPAGCVFRGDSLRVSLPGTHRVRNVAYRIEGLKGAIAGRGARFGAALPTAGLTSGTHRLTARITFRSGKPHKQSKTRTFAVC